jgi:hypothetical protein
MNNTSSNKTFEIKVILPLEVVPRNIPLVVGNIPRHLYLFLCSYGGSTQWFIRCMKRLNTFKTKDFRRTRTEIKRINIVWNAFASAILVLEPRFLSGLKSNLSSNNRHVKALIGIRSFMRWFLTTGSNCGVSFLILRMKFLCDWFEFYSAFPENVNDFPVGPRGLIGMKDDWQTLSFFRGSLSFIKPTCSVSRTIKFNKKLSSKLFTLYSMKGGFGPPTSEITLRSLKKFKDVVTTPIVVDDRLIDLSLQWARCWAKAHPLKRKFGNPHMTCGYGACVGYSVKEGGRARFYTEMLDQYRALSYRVNRRSDTDVYYNIWGDVILSGDVWSYLLIQQERKPLVMATSLKEVLISGDPDTENQKIDDKEKWKGSLGNYQYFDCKNGQDNDQYLAESGSFAHLHSLGAFDCKIDIPDGCEVMHLNLHHRDGDATSNSSLKNSNYTFLYNNLFTNLYTMRVDLDIAWSNLFFNNILSYEVEAVDDQGAKARVITKSKPSISGLTHLVRGVIQNRMESDTDCHALASGGSVGGLLRKFSSLRETPESGFMNLDLTMATDTFCSLICEHLARGASVLHPSDAFYSESLNKKLELLSRTVGAQARLRFSDKSENLFKRMYEKKMKLNPDKRNDLRQELKELICPFFSRRGQFMGTPPSWVVLNLYLKFFMSVTSFMYKKKVTLMELLSSLDLTREFIASYSKLNDLISHRCGDDQVSWVNLQIRKIFLDNLRYSGAIPSNGTNTFSKNVLHFCKSLYFKCPGELRQMKKSDTYSRSHIKSASYVKIKALCKRIDAPRLPGMRLTNINLTRGSAMRSQVLRFSHIDDPDLFYNINHCKMICIWNNSRSIDSWKTFGLCPWTPNFLCGLGYPRPEEKPLKNATKRIVGLAILLFELDTSWKRLRVRWKVWHLMDLQTALTRKSSELVWDFIKFNVEPFKFKDFNELDIITEGDYKWSLGQPIWLTLEDFQQYSYCEISFSEPDTWFKLKETTKKFGLVSVTRLLKTLRNFFINHFSFKTLMKIGEVFPTAGSVSDGIEKCLKEKSTKYHFKSSVQKLYRSFSNSDFLKRKNHLLGRYIMIDKNYLSALFEENLLVNYLQADANIQLMDNLFYHSIAPSEQIPLSYPGNANSCCFLL